jgi:eukaryotic-like serine/threonine-protein kinase
VGCLGTGRPPGAAPRSASLLVDMASESRSVEPGSHAKRLFVEHVVRSEGAVDIEPLCSAHPELAGEIRALHGRWLRGNEGGSLLGRLRQRPAASPGHPTQPVESPGERPARSSDSGSSIWGRIAARGGPTERYRPEGEIARGGMGAILRVWDADLRRTLAMKVSLARGGEGSQSADSSAARLLERFLEEAQITGQLEHPGIVPVHELGIDADGRVYFTMRLVKGLELHKVFELARKGEDGWNRTRALGVLLKVCEAVAFAHEKGVVHRDLKPANVMVGRLGETYVMDWGLARVLGQADRHDVRVRQPSAPRSIVRTDRADERASASPLVTMDGDIIGTPCYMPPEQARGKLEEIGPPADVYAVGSMLYQLLTGRMPYAGEDDTLPPQTVLRMLLDGPPTPLRALDRTIPDELEAICERAMARESRERYPTMLAMAEDLRAFLEERVVQAHASGPVAEFKKWIRRNRAAALLGATALLLAIAGLTTVVLLQARSNKRLTQAKQDVEAARDDALAAKQGLERANADLGLARDEANKQTQQARHSEYAANIAAASASLRLADAAEARRRLLLCEESRRGWEWQHLWLASDESVAKLGDGSSQPVALAWHPSGELLAATTSVSFLVSGPVELRRVADGSLVRSIETPGGLPGVLAFTPDGERLAWAHRDKTIHLSSIETGAEVGAFGEHRGPITDLAFAPDGRTAATAANDKLVRLWDVASGTLLHELEGHRSAVASIAFGRGGALLASASRDRTVRLWDTASGKLLRTLEGSEYPLVFVAFDPSGLRVAAGSQAFEGLATETVARGANTIRLWDVDQGTLLSVFSGPRAQLNSGAFSPDGSWLCAASRDSGLWLWDLRSGRDQFLLGHDLSLIDVAFAPDGARIATTSDDHSIRLWDPELRSGFSLRGHAAQVECARFARGGELLVTSSSDGTLRVWSTQTGLLETVLRGHRGNVLDVAIDAAGELAASASADKSVRLWDLSSGRELACIGTPHPLMTGEIPRSDCVAFDPSGRTLAIAHRAGALELWDVERRSTVQTWTTPALDTPLAVRWSPTGERIAVLRRDYFSKQSQLELIDSGSGERLAERTEGQLIGAIAWAPDGNDLAAGFDRRVCLLDPATLGERSALVAQEDSIAALAFSPDGQRLVSASSSGADPIRIWERATGEALLALTAPQTEVDDLAFSPRGDAIAATCADWSAFLWCTTSNAEREQARSAERKARRALLPQLDALFGAFGDPERVLERLSADPGLDAARLRRAARLARLVPADPGPAENEIWRALRMPGELEEDVHVALWGAQVYARLAPDDEQTQMLLGAALYRTGRMEEAHAALKRADELSGTRGSVGVLAFLCMASMRLGDRPGAEHAFAKLSTLMQIPNVLIRRDNQSLLLEAESVLRLGQ